MINYITLWDWKIINFLNPFFALHGGFSNKLVSEYLIYSLPLILIVLWFFNPQGKIVVLRAVFSAILAWPIIAQIIGSLYNRPRPFMVGEIQEVIFHRPTYSFPSDHAAALFAVGFSILFSGYKKLAGLVLLLAFIICFYRVATGIHFPSDIIAGAIIGLTAALIIKFADGMLKPVYNFIINLLKKIKLA
jgi:membrane-associated phospholipid phosphatase